MINSNRSDLPEESQAAKDSSMAVTIIIPAYNEEHSIGQQIQALRFVMDGANLVYEILVIDDGSTDKTLDESLLSGVRVLKHPVNVGYGASLKTGIRAAAYDVIVIIDADSTYPASQIPIMLEMLTTADMVVGARIGDEVKVPLSRRPAKWLLQKLAIRISGQDIPDLNSGMRIFRKEAAQQYFSILPNRFSFTTTITLAYMADSYRVAYHPINYYARIGKSKIVPWHFIDFLVLIIRISLMFNPLKIFIPLALFFGGLGGLKLAFDMFALFLRTPGGGWQLLLQPALSTSALLLIFTGLQFLMIGMLADGVVRRIAHHNRPQAPSYGYVAFDYAAKENLSTEDVSDSI